MKRHLIISLLLGMILALSFPLYAQQVQNIKGNVVDEVGEPVIGASVKIDGTGVGTITDLNGNFAISVPSNGKLTISYIGYVTQTISNFENTRIVLAEDPMQLSEVVVVGYGQQKKAHLTGAIATVAPDEITDLSVTGLSSALVGQVTGVSVSQSSNRPGESGRITIRNSDLAVSAPSSSSGLLVPLYVIDDYIADEAAFNNLDANMVESITILKDAAAAVFGARSAQGVVLVKTKRGQVGKPKISYSGQYGYTDEFYRSKMLDSYNFGLIWNGIRAADPTSPYDKKNHLFQADELAAMQGLNYDLLEQYWKSALTQRHSVNVSGGSENATYFGGIAYITQGGNLGRIDYDRWNYRTGMDFKIGNWIKTSLQVSGDYANISKAFATVGGTNAEKDYATLLTRPRYIPEYVNGLPIAAYGITNGQIEQTQNYNYDVVENIGNFTKNMPQNMTINSSLEYDFGWNQFLKGLKMKVTYSKSINTTKDNQFGSDYTLYKFADGGRGGSGSHLYVDTDGYPMSFDGMTTFPVSNGNRIRRSFSRGDSYQINFITTYARSFGLHDVSGLFTIEKAESESENIWGQVTEPYSFTNLQSNGAKGDQTTEFSRSEAGVLSYVGRLNYAYADRYLAEFLIRTDASTKFAPENYWGVFPSLSLGWVISEENWFKESVNFMNYLKIRGSYGILGRDNVAPWAWMQYYGSEVVKGPIFGNNPDLNAGSHFQIPNAVPNRNSHWDKSYKSNLGLDMNFLKSRMTVTIDGYYDRNRDVFMAITNAPDYPTTVGALASASNYGSIDNYGLEFTLGWRDRIGKDFRYYVRVNTGYTDNKILKAPWVDTATRGLEDLVPNERADRGLWGYSYIGMFQSYQQIAEYFSANNLVTYLGRTQSDVHPGMLIYKDIRGSQKADGTYYDAGDPSDPLSNVVDKNDLVRISKYRSNPYGFTVNMGGDWKGLSFSAQFASSWGSYTMMPSEAINNKSIISTSSGYDVMQYTNLPSFWANNMFIYQDVMDDKGNVVAAKNLDAKYPNLRFAGINGVASTFWKVNNTIAQLRNITLAYALPREWVTSMGVEGCRINVTGQNMFNFYNPYPDKFMSPMSSYSTYPTLRKITVGLNITF